MSSTEEHLDSGDISRGVYLILSSVLFAISIISSTIRTIWKWRQYGRLKADDYVLIFAVLLYVAAAVLYFIAVDDVFFVMLLNLNPYSNYTLQSWMSPDFPGRVKRIIQEYNAIFCLIIASIFLVKLTLLIFFRQLVNRLDRMLIYWKVVVGVTVVSGLFCVSFTFVACSNTGLAALECASAQGVKRMTLMNSFLVALDVTTDLLIILIPVIVLWQVQIKPRQKYMLGIFLCLSIFMIITAIVRVSKQTIDGDKGDFAWAFFLLFLESSIAIIMVSITAFRSLLGLKSQAKKDNRDSTNRSWRDLLSWNTNTRCGENNDVESLPAIPQPGYIYKKTNYIYYG